ncbi:MAG: GTP 3',8-cyclase MoaA [Bacteroidetes bacterium]|nr:GTP 3',8-cyclase MoaA [Bacteroidota bacterium]MBS1973201.1 GTP 3',8-cyclase MoaA [Bacteroidota bacterium]
MLKDRFGRIHDYLRISITDKCNLRCTYCNPVDLPKGYFSGCTKMTVAEIEKMASLFVQQGIKKIRLTGGEPLVRKDAREIIERLSKYPVELTITTNGVFVHEYIDVFKAAGIKSVNVSLDSLNKKTFFDITGRNEFERVMQNIELLLEKDFYVKINSVIIKGINDEEIPRFIEWTKYRPVHVRFIEFMPFAGNDWSGGKIFSYQEMLKLISSQFDFIKLPDEKSQTAKKYLVPGYKGTFAVISTMTQPFCSDCNRLRLTTDGKMKNCLFSKKETDLLSALRAGEDIAPLIRQCLFQKEEAMGGQFTDDIENMDASAIQNRSMINIGG